MSAERNKDIKSDQVHDAVSEIVETTYFLLDSIQTKISMYTFKSMVAREQGYYIRPGKMQ